MAGDIKYEIQEMYGVISDPKSGWTKELNLISWNTGKAKFDIRDWSPEHEKMGKGITLSEEEAKTLYSLLGEIFNN